MVLETKHTIIAYRCPHCGTGVMSAVGMSFLIRDDIFFCLRFLPMPWLCAAFMELRPG
jgi:hypothetical protein